MNTVIKSSLALTFLALTACGGDQPADTPAPAMPTAQTSAPAPQAPACNRGCLIEMANIYVAALAANDPSIPPLADDIAFVENVTRLQPGEGLWQSTVEGPSTFAIFVPDLELQQVGFLGVMKRRIAVENGGENGEEEQPIVFAIRLKRGDNGQITEAEHLVSAIRPDFLANMQSPRPGLLAQVPEESRLSYDALATMGMAYYDALDDNDGSLMPFADDCERHENGMITAGPQTGPGPVIPGDASQAPVARTCAAQLDSLTFTYIDRIENRRLVAVDPVTGLVMGLSHFRHPMDNLPYDVIHTDGSTSQRTNENMPFQPFDLPAAHIFKFGADGLVHEIEAMGFTAPLDSPTGWE